MEYNDATRSDRNPAGEINRRDLLRGAAAMAVAAPVVGALGSGTAAAQDDPGPCPLSGVSDISIDGFLNHDELRHHLLHRLPKSTQGRVRVEEIGRSHRGREIWSATVGHGPKVILAQSEIHGNEKHGTRALLKVLQQLGNAGVP